MSTLAAGEVASLAKERSSKYSTLPVTHFFTLVAMERTGAVGPKSIVFLKELGGQRTNRGRVCYSFLAAENFRGRSEG